MAVHARGRTISNPQAGQIVYYFLRGKDRNEAGYKGPARVIAVEPPMGDSQAASVVWLSHGATLVRAAPEHLRVATPLEHTVYEVIQGPAAPPGSIGQDGERSVLQTRYVDLGEVPSCVELEDAIVGVPFPQEPPPDVLTPAAPPVATESSSAVEPAIFHVRLPRSFR